MASRTNDFPYEDIVNLPHHVSPSRARMSVYDRAAQFSPFAALTGYGDAVEETARMTEQFRDMDENKKTQLDRKLQILVEYQNTKPTVQISFFVPDERKAGGAYKNFLGRFVKLDDHMRQLVFEQGMRVDIDLVRDIQGDIFAQFMNE